MARSERLSSLAATWPLKPVNGDAGSSLLSCSDDVCRDSSLPPNPTTQVSTLSMNVSIAATGLGFGLERNSEG